MKKIIGLLGVAIFAVAMFFNTNMVNESGSDLNLSNLSSMNSAEAACEVGWRNGKCDFTGQICYESFSTSDCHLEI